MISTDKDKITDVAPYYANRLPFWEELTFEQLEAIDELMALQVSMN